MRYNLEKIRIFAIESSLVKNPQVSFLSEGYGNLNYLICENDNKFVLRIKKDLEHQFDDSLEREYVFLSFFADQKIDFCPKPFFFDKKKNYLIEEFISGKHINHRQLSDQQIDLFAKQLYRLFSLSVDEFRNFCEKNNFKKIKHMKLNDFLQQYGYERLELASQGKVVPDVLAWIKNNLDQNLKNLKKQIKTVDLGFNWGDIQSEMIMDNQGKLFFFDFEHMRITDSPGLTYIKIHGDFNNEQFEFLLQRYAHHAKAEIAKLREKIKENERLIRVNDVVWAAMMWAQTNNESFKKLTIERIALVENLC